VIETIGLAVTGIFVATVASCIALGIAVIAGLPGVFLFDRAPHFPLTDAATERVRKVALLVVFVPQAYVLLALDAVAVSYISLLAAQNQRVHAWMLYLSLWLYGTWLIEKSAAIEPKSKHHLLLSAGLIWAARLSELAFWGFVVFPAAMRPWAWLPFVR
jgi:hypothetical protein